MDKLDYIIRDPHNTFASQRKPGGQIDAAEILKTALVVLVNVDEDRGRCRQTRIAYHMSPVMQLLINRVFEARAAMHLDVYQLGCVIHCVLLSLFFVLKAVEVCIFRPYIEDLS
jgi:HD superfamily phosphohydrolase